MVLLGSDTSCQARVGVESKSESIFLGWSRSRSRIRQRFVDSAVLLTISESRSSELDSGLHLLDANTHLQL